jgi:hypothetical protein
MRHHDGTRLRFAQDSPLEGWREMDSNFWYRGTKAVDFRGIPGIAGASAGR